MVAASLCIKPTPTLTLSEVAKVGALKEASPSFVVMRGLAMRFRGLLQGADASKLDRFLILQIMPEQPTNENQARKVTQTPGSRHWRPALTKSTVSAMRAPWRGGTHRGKTAFGSLSRS